MKKVIAVILITIGMVVIIQAIGLKTYTKVKENQLIDEFEDELEKKIDGKQEPLTSDPPTEDEVNKMKSLLGGEKLAIIEIPKIGVKSIIVEGTEMRHLKYYVGHFTQTKMPGEYGNFAISGHSSTIYTEVFNKVHTLKPDDMIKITTLFGEYDYYVTNVEMVDPYRYDVLDDEEGKRTLTIVTCNENGSMRLIVKSEMDESIDNGDSEIDEGNSPQNDQVQMN